MVVIFRCLEKIFCICLRFISRIISIFKALDNVALLENYDKPRLNLTLKIFCCGHIGWLHKKRLELFLTPKLIRRIRSNTELRKAEISVFPFNLYVLISTPVLAVQISGLVWELVLSFFCLVAHCVEQVRQWGTMTTRETTAPNIAAWFIMSPPYLYQLVRVADLPGRHLSWSHRLQVPTHRSAFISSYCIHPIEKPVSWYSVVLLPDRFLFHQSFPDILL